MSGPSPEQLREWKRQSAKAQTGAEGKVNRKNAKAPTPPAATPQIPEGSEDVVMGGESSRDFLERVKRFGWNSSQGAIKDETQRKLQRLKAEIHADALGTHDGMPKPHKPFDPHSPHAEFVDHLKREGRLDLESEFRED